MLKLRRGLSSLCSESVPPPQALRKHINKSIAITNVAPAVAAIAMMSAVWLPPPLLSDLAFDTESAPLFSFPGGVVRIELGITSSSPECESLPFDRPLDSEPLTDLAGAGDIPGAGEGAPDLLGEGASAKYLLELAAVLDFGSRDAKVFLYQLPGLASSPETG